MERDDSLKTLVGLTDRLSNALLLHGPPGIGKRGLAERYAKFLLCEDAQKRAVPCERCNACRWTVAGNHPDLRWVEPEASAGRRPIDGEDGPAEKSGKASTEIRIDQIRELAEFLNVGSHRGRRRVIIIHPAEAMNAAAANALLKGLEEPPESALFILVSHAPARLLATVRSRCISVGVGLPAREEALRWLGEQGLADAGRWLDFAGGSPLRAVEYAQGPQAGALKGMLGALHAGDHGALRASVENREGLELLVEVAQRHALDRASVAMGCGARFGTTMRAQPGGGESANRWLSLARWLGGSRRVARHPVNHKLFVEEVLIELDGCCSK